MFVSLHCHYSHYRSRLESGAAGSLDVVSIVTLSEDSRALILEQPTSWLLYNQIVALYESKSVLPQGHGPYMPSLDLAEALLNVNSNASCAMGLCFISDGKPSDHHFLELPFIDCVDVITEKVASLAKQFGRRLQFTAIGIGDEDFSTLQEMVDVANDYGAKASMNLPSRSAGILGDVLETFSSSVTSTQTEMTCLATLKQQCVKSVTRESKRKATHNISIVGEEDFFIYGKPNVQRQVYKEWYEDKKRRHCFEETSLQNSNAHFVAMHEHPFGEGSERFAYRFFEVGADRKSVTGIAMVAKESRFILDGKDTESARQRFVKIFCETQQLAGRIATEFNAMLDNLIRVGDSTPRVLFLDCSVYTINDINLGKNSVLVEEKLDHTKWMKWNSNNGYVAGMKKTPTFNDGDIEGALQRLKVLDLNLDIIEEDEEDEYSDERSVTTETNHNGRNVSTIDFDAFQVAQAFSHFSYWATGRKRLICDLQGVFDDARNLLCLSDPVIHYDYQHNGHKRMLHGRTDRGRKGISLFFETHECSNLCYLVTNGFKRSQQRLQHRA